MAEIRQQIVLPLPSEVCIQKRQVNLREVEDYVSLALRGRLGWQGPLSGVVASASAMPSQDGPPVGHEIYACCIKSDNVISQLT